MPPHRRGVTGRAAGPLRAPLDHLLGARSRVAVLRVLAAGGAPLSQRELARRAGVQVRSSQEAVERLVALGVATRLVGGRDHLVSLNRRHPLAGPLLSLFLAEADRFRRVRERIAFWAKDRRRARSVAGLVLFGSGARGDDTPSSDLDVLLVTADGAASDRLADEFAELAEDLHGESGVRARLLAYTLDEARRLWRRRTPPFPDVVRDGVALVGPPPAELLAR